MVLAMFLINSCATGPQTIDYGNDGCHFCKMTIVEKIHGSELITDKGKVFKFDATECMLNYINDNKELPVSNLLTNYYEVPTEFIAVEEAVFLISEKLPSPMGANLTAFKTRVSAEKVQSEKGGNLYNWEELKIHLKKR
jgi:copper chaperone NosL